MKVLRSEKRLCLSCMKEHIIDIIETEEQETFNGAKVNFKAVYEYCSNTDEYLETEQMIKANGLAVKDAYRKVVGLLTSDEIRHIRDKYCVSQKEFSEILDWGKATITRYENHQIQDRAHDDILRKIDSDPKWFLEMLERAKRKISPKLYVKYYNAAYEHYAKTSSRYFYSTINTNTVINVANSIMERVCVDRLGNRSYKTCYSGPSYLELPTPIKGELLFAM